MEKPTGYIETSIVSYLTARPSRDLIVAAHQQLTHTWWQNERKNFDLYISQMVLNEASAGDAEAATQRLALLADINVLRSQSEVLTLAQCLIQAKAVPAVALDDSVHIAMAAVNGMDYLLTWNCTHIANAVLLKKISNVCMDFGVECPTICTPPEMLGEGAEHVD